MSAEPDDPSGGLSEDAEEVLYRVDERTKRMDDRLDEVIDNTQENASEIDDIKGDVRRNSTILNGITVGGVALVTWVADKLTRLNIL